MPFGLTNALATFQCVMKTVLQPFLRKFCVDSILIYGPTLEQHVDHLQQVFHALRSHQLYLKPSKCSFAQPSVEYLGHIISGQGVSTDPAKTAAMQLWPRPTSVAKSWGFLGLTGYYRRFVRNYGGMARPLTQLLKKNAFSWTDAAEQAFLQLKTALSTTPVLALPNFQLPFTGQPIAFLSKGLSDKHKGLSIYEKEFLALIMAVEKWRQYLQRQQFTILTDHKSLAYLTEQQLHSDIQKML
ncbi:hypothetical protein U9M48_004437 [Paspalum notatum var. saurae]|uniref:Reverse transcriptase domain-containing protein n=1 Tax=Paspalum notatum var. saurae TaxID=547442 RepID=A0AAQ3SHP5_PASNO